MKKRSLTALMAVMAFMIGFTHPAHAGKEYKAEMVDTLRQSADELQGSNPELAEKLNRYADKKEEWMEHKEKKGGEYHQQKKEDLQTLKEAATALQENEGTSSLGNEVEDIVNRWEEKLQKKHEHKDR